MLCYILLVYTVSQRHVHLYLRMHDQQVPGNKGDTAMPAVAVVSALFSSVALEQIQVRDQKAYDLYGMQPHHLLICDALGLNSSWYDLHSAPFFAVRQQFWQNLLKRGENEFYTDNCRHSNQLFLEDFSVNHTFLQPRRPMSAPLG